MSIRKNFFVFTVIILSIFVILTYQGIKGGVDTTALSFLNHPLRSLKQELSAVVSSIEDLFQKYILIAGKETEIKRLTSELHKKKEENNKYAEAQYENERLRELLELKFQKKEYVTTAEVFARDPTNWFQILWINKGKKDGISKNMVAVTPLGIVGRVHRVFKGSATIILITDVNSSVAARLQSSRIEGIIGGRGHNKCYLKYVPREVDVLLGDRVITSGFDEIFPAGLVIGYVTDTEKKPGEFFQLIEITVAQNLSSVEEVSILKR
ncbi:MAG: rod shape-determining protein MreC [Thermodesulfovibrionia bacterium]|nr:rod shape-determining protein MreC [Thermodesulfovibrionia bacterium]MCK5426614.1 rod shape-determining protein MreC [Thermodesulfovibrionia bacterium]